MPSATPAEAQSDRATAVSRTRPPGEGSVRAELAEQLGGAVDPVALRGQAKTVGEQSQRHLHGLVTFGERGGAVALGQAAAVGRQHQRHVRVAGNREVQRARQEDLARRRVGEVGAADDFADPLRSVVDHHSELVGGDPVSAADDEVVDNSDLAPEQSVLEGDQFRVGPETQRVRAPGR